MYNYLLNHTKVENKYTKNKRSKSETLLTLVLNTNNSGNNSNDGNNHLAILQMGETKSKNFFSLMARRRSSKGSNKSSNKSNNLLDPSTLAGVAGGSCAAKSKSNVHLNNLQATSRGDESAPRRFSLRSFFSKSGGRSNADNNSISKEHRNRIEDGPMHRNMSNSLSQSINSTDVPSSRPMTPIRMQSLTNATGSALKFHQSFKMTHPNKTRTAQSGAQSHIDLNANRIDTHTESNNLNFLSLDTRRELFQKARDFSNSLRRDDDDDIDKCFNEYAAKNGANNVTNCLTPDGERAMRNSLSRQMDLREKYAIDGVDNVDPVENERAVNRGKKRVRRKQLFGFLFKSNKGGSEDAKSKMDAEDSDDFGAHFRRHRRSRTLDAAAKNKFKIFKRKNSLVGSEKNATAPMGTYLDSYVYGADFSDPENDNSKENGNCSTLFTLYIKVNFLVLTLLNL
jgi:hypothetical protein